MKSTMIILLLIFCACTSPKKINQDKPIENKRGALISFGNNGSTYSEIFIEGRFSRKKMIDQLAAKKEWKMEVYTLSIEGIYSFRKKAIKYEVDEEFSIYTFGLPVYIAPVKIKYGKFIAEEGFFDPRPIN